MRIKKLIFSKTGNISKFILQGGSEKLIFHNPLEAHCAGLSQWETNIGKKKKKKMRAKEINFSFIMVTFMVALCMKSIN